MKAALFLPFLAAIAAPALPGQLRSFQCIVLVHAGVTDMVLNAPLVDGLLADPACRDRLRTALDAQIGEVECRSELPAAHLPGTFQIHVRATIGTDGEWTVARENAAIHAIGGHLRDCLERLLLTDPRARLGEREQVLMEQITKAGLEQNSLRARVAAAERNAATLARQADAVEQQLAAARVEVATEQSVAAQLEQLHERHLKEREELRESVQRLDAQRQTLEARIAELSQRLQEADDSSRREALRAECQKVDAEAKAARPLQDRLQDRLQDAQRMLAVVLEQLPANALALHKARARLQSLGEEQQRLDARRADGAAEARELAVTTMQIDRLGSEIAACQTQLGVVRSKLAQLEPVRCEVLRAPR